MRHRMLVAAFASALTCASVATAVPTGLRVSPVVVTFPASSGAGSVRIDNGRATATSFQIDVYRWTQVDGADVLAPTRDIAVAPSIFELAPGAGRIVRVALAPARRTADREQAFRLIVRELPTGEAVAGRARVVLELSLPVFATVRDAASQLVAHRDGAAITVANAGSGHMRVLALKTGYGADVVPGAPRYLLAGSVMRRPLSANVDALRVLFIPVGAHEPVEQSIRVRADPAAVGAHDR